MVRGGWSTFTEGIVSQQGMNFDRQRVRQGQYADGSPRFGWISNNTPTGYVTVDYQFAPYDRRPSEEPQRAAVEVLTRAAETLRAKGFEVEERFGSEWNPSLTVCRKDADGEVIRF